jgi:molybdate transport system substrate-binding protein
MRRQLFAAGRWRWPAAGVRRWPAAGVRRRLAAVTAVSTAMAVLAAGCGGSGTAGQRTGADTGAPGGRLSGDVVVFAASSLTEVFGRLGREFEARHPGVHMRFSFGGSSSLGPQIVSGAPVDVFAAASPSTMADVVRAGVTARRPVLFARNRLQIAVPPDNPGRVRGLDDFARPGLTLAVCAPQVPCGEAAQDAFDVGGVRAQPDTLEQEVKGVLTKVELGEVDAGMVYHTDVVAAGARVRGVSFPEAAKAINDYQIAPVAGAPNPAAARAWTRFVLSPHGQRALADAGFDVR